MADMRHMQLWKREPLQEERAHALPLRMKSREVVAHGLSPPGVVLASTIAYAACRPSGAVKVGVRSRQIRRCSTCPQSTYSPGVRFCRVSPRAETIAPNITIRVAACELIRW